MSQNAFLSDVLGAAPIPPGKLAYFRARLSNALHQLILQRFAELEKTNKTFNRAYLARRIGKKPEQVTRWLGAAGNWELETVSDLLLGMGCELSASIVDLRQLVEANTPRPSPPAAAKSRDEPEQTQKRKRA